MCGSVDMIDGVVVVVVAVDGAVVVVMCSVVVVVVVVVVVGVVVVVVVAVSVFMGLNRHRKAGLFWIGQSKLFLSQTNIHPDSNETTNSGKTQAGCCRCCDCDHDQKRLVCRFNRLTLCVCDNAASVYM